MKTPRVLVNLAVVSVSFGVASTLAFVLLVIFGGGMKVLDSLATLSASPLTVFIVGCFVIGSFAITTAGVVSYRRWSPDKDFHETSSTTHRKDVPRLSALKFLAVVGSLTTVGIIFLVSATRLLAQHQTINTPESQSRIQRAELVKRQKSLISEYGSGARFNSEEGQRLARQLLVDFDKFETQFGSRLSNPERTDYLAGRAALELFLDEFESMSHTCAELQTLGERGMGFAQQLTVIALKKQHDAVSYEQLSSLVNRLPRTLGKLLLGEHFLDRGQHERAIEELKSVSQSLAEPSSSDAAEIAVRIAAIGILARAYNANKEFDSTISAADAAVKVGTPLLKTASFSILARRNLEVALAQCQMELGLAYEMTGQNDLAIKACQAALSLLHKHVQGDPSGRLQKAIDEQHARIKALSPLSTAGDAGRLE